MVNTLWNLGHLYKSEHITSKYDLLSREFSNYRVLYLNDIMEHPEVTLPKYVINFIVKEGAVLMIANIVKGTAISILFRSLNKKSFIDYGTTKGVFYGLGELKIEKYGQPIVIVEGVADRDILSKIYPNVLSTKSSSLSVLQVELLSSLTNRVILALDQDEPGRKGCSLALRRLRAKGVRCRIIDHPNVKDPGEIYDYLVAKNKTKAKELISEYSLRLKAGIQCLN